MPSATAVCAAVLASLSFLYPAFVYSLDCVLPPQAFTGLALLLVGLRLATLRSEAIRIWRRTTHLCRCRDCRLSPAR